ncbi:uncharacterized protein TNCV_5084691 [Trichonephila clavipes]|uniref:CCHC-type domain-containing protein n=1 Tax=Trichonephila clavipes TaxID=2585209 RepID=A0A8X6V727_TRICX|nr:uncharacterized protein TNCV_5084691 [Trichonephila clavipes]
MDEQLKALLEGINALKNIIGNVEKRQEELRNILEKKIEQVEERYERLAGNFSLISQRVEDFEKKLLDSGNAANERKFVPAAQVSLPASPVSVKLYTYDGKPTGRCTRFNLTLTDTELLNLNSLYNALDLRFGQKFSKDYVSLQMKTRRQKPEESLQEYAFEMQRLTTLAFSDFSANVREMISLEYFVDGLKDEEIQMAVRMAVFKDFKYALLYSLKIEAATQASCIDRHSIREARVMTDEPCESRCIKEIEKMKEEMQALISQRQNRRRGSITCWGCGESGHLRSNCPRNKKEDHSTKCWGCWWSRIHKK